MDLVSVVDVPTGTKMSLLVDVIGADSEFTFGLESPFGTKVAFIHAGVNHEGRMALYDISTTGVQHDDSWILQINEFQPLRSTPFGITSLGYFHDVCCGLGGFSTAFEQLGCQVVTAVDSCELAVRAYQLNHSSHVICGDIASVDVLFQMHQRQLGLALNPVLAAGFPCQPLSRQGAQMRQWDHRSKTLGAILKASYMLQSAGLFLECVPEALTDSSTQRQLLEFCQLRNFTMSQRVLHLHSCWPSRRSRWFCVLLPSHLGSVSFPPLPALPDPPSVMKLMPYSLWPCWSMQDEEQLRWTAIEEQVYRDPQYGPVDRSVQTQQPLPTALHTWGNALYGCPCGCRATGLSPRTLRSGGLRGLAIVSGCWPHHTRHIHPKELQLFLGFPPFEKTLDDCRAQLCLFGNAVAPLQVLWIWSHVMQLLGLLHEGQNRNAIMTRYIDMILHQRDISWPSPFVGSGTLTLCTGDTSLDIRFHTAQTVGQLVTAQAELEQTADVMFLTCQGSVLPLSAFLQERTYTIHAVPVHAASPHLWVPVIVLFLGQTNVCWVPPSLTVSQLLAWQGIFQYAKVLNAADCEVPPHEPVGPWKVIIVQQDPDDVAFDLSVTGFGPLRDNLPIGLLKTTESWICTGLWHLDQLIKSQLLLTWTGLDFSPLTVWLPSFAAAVLELWPSSMDSQIACWLSPPETQLHAFVYEQWGWSLVLFTLTAQRMQVTFLEPEGHLAVTSRVVAHRAFWVSNRQHMVEFVRKISGEGDDLKSLDAVMRVFHQELGITSALISEYICKTADLAHGLDFGLSPSPTVPLSLESNLVHPAAAVAVTEDQTKQGLTAKFLLRFAKAIVANTSGQVLAGRIQVIHLDQHRGLLQQCSVRAWVIDQSPLSLFVLVDGHWIFAKCELTGSHLAVRVFDGLAQTPLSSLAPLVVSLKKAWNAETISVSTSWIIAQSRGDSCGTVALGHFALLSELISYEQAMHFEQLHPSFAVASCLLGSCRLSGFGPDDRSVAADLAKILPSKGVPEDQLKERTQAALKAFGAEAIAKALRTNNPWASLKQLGNSRPRPFMWVTNQELQLHIQDRSQKEYGVQHDTKRKKHQKEQRKQPFAAHSIDPNSLLMPPGLFVTNSGEAVPQIAVDAVCKNARGVAFALPQDVQQFLSDGKMISPDALSVLVIGALPASAPRSLPMHHIQAPAIYRGTDEPILIDCTIIQLGDQAVYRKQNQQAPEVAVFPTAVFRVHVFRDLWISDHSWDDLVARPVKSLVGVFDILRLCKDQECQGFCGFCHPSCEEEGIESGLLDIWAFHWHAHDGSRTPPPKSDVLSIYFRVPESSFRALHALSGTYGVFFEPRHSDKPGPDDRYAVVWLPPCTLSEAMHRVKTLDEGIAVCRLGNKYGIRCLVKDQEDLHKIINPTKPFVSCNIKQIFRIEPLPAGTQRQSLVDTLHAVGWKAKPLQPCRGSQGRAWNVGAEDAPPSPFIETQHGWISISKVKDTWTQAKPQEIIATVRTRQHITAASSSSTSASQDPWHVPGGDPWAGYNNKSIAAAPSQHVQKKIDDVEQKLAGHVQAAIDAQVQQFKGDEQARDRLTSVENQIQSIICNQQKLENWAVESSAKTAVIQVDQATLGQAVQQCQQTVHEQGQTLQQVAQDVATCSSTITSQGHTLQQVAQDVTGIQRDLTTQLESYFSKQAATIEALIEKRQRHS